MEVKREVHVFNHDGRLKALSELYGGSLDELEKECESCILKKALLPSWSPIDNWTDAPTENQKILLDVRIEQLSLEIARRRAGDATSPANTTGDQILRHLTNLLPSLKWRSAKFVQVYLESREPIPLKDLPLILKSEDRGKVNYGVPQNVFDNLRRALNHAIQRKQIPLKLGQRGMKAVFELLPDGIRKKPRRRKSAGKKQ